MERCKWLWTFVLFVSFLGNAAYAQVTTAIIDGRVSDKSGAVIPGVTVTLTGTGVMGSRDATTDERGGYRFNLLPPGTYNVKFELPGFSTVVREDIRLTAGFTATINAELQVGTVAETLTVSGQSPVVDVESSAIAVNFTSDLIRNIPNARDMWGALAVSPGVQMTRHDVGSYSSGSQSGYRTYGADGQNITAVDGVIVNDGNSSTGLFLDYGSFEEVQVSGASKGAQVQLSGANMNLTVKSGGNDIHGMFFSDYSTKGFQSNNLTQRVKDRGFNGVNSQDLFYDINANTGGPFLKDRFWWFTSYRHTYNKVENPLFQNGGCTTGEGCTGQAPGTFSFTAPPAGQGVPYIWLDNLTLKFNFQLTPSNQVSYTGQASNKRGPFYDAFGAPDITNARFFTSDSVSNQHYPGWYQTWKWASTLSPRATLNMSVNNWGFAWKNDRRVDEYSRRDLDTQAIRGGYSGRGTGFQTGSGTSGPYPWVSRRRRWHYNLNFAATMNNVITGTHNIDAGYVYNYQTHRFTALGTVGHVVLYYRGGFQTPAFIDTADTPFTSVDGLRKQAVFFNDRWNIGQKLTLNIGLREDLATGFYPDQKKEGVGPYQTPQTVPGHTFDRMGRLVPRLSFVYNVFGDGRTAVKGSYSQYAFDPAENISSQGNPLSQTLTRYNWDGTLPFDPRGKAVVSTVGGPDRSVSPDLELPYTTEYTAGLDQQLMPDLSLRLEFVRKLDYHFYQQYNIAIPFSAYNIPTTGVDPGPDGVTGNADDRTLSLFSLDPAFVGKNKGLYQNNPGVENNYSTIEASVVKRFSNKYQFLTGWDYVHRSTSGGVPQDPNALRYRNVQRYWTWTYKIVGTYEAPYQVNLSAVFRASKGEPYGRRVNSPRLNQGVITLVAEPTGTYFNDTVRLLDFRAEKTFVVSERWGKISAIFDLFNIFNSDAITAVSDLTGVNQFQTVSQTLTPRIFRLGARFEF